MSTSKATATTKGIPPATLTSTGDCCCGGCCDTFSCEPIYFSVSNLVLYDEDGSSITIPTSSFTLTAYFDVPDLYPDKATVRARKRWFRSNLGVDGDGYTHIINYASDITGECYPENVLLSTPQRLGLSPTLYYRLYKYKVGPAPFYSCETVVLAEWFWVLNILEDNTCDLADLETPSPVSVSEGGGGGPGMSFDYEIIKGSGGDDTDGCLHEVCEGPAGTIGGQTPSWACCDNSTDWFCDPDIVPDTMTGSFTSGACSGSTVSLQKSSFIQNGVERGAWVMVTNISGVSNTFLSCDGTLYGYDTYGVSSIGTVTTIHSCNPLDFEITLTSGIPNSACDSTSWPCGTGIIRITE